MEQFPINFAALVVATIVRNFVGFCWYSKNAWGPKWMKLTGQTPASIKAGMAKAIGTDTALGLIMAFVLVHAVHYAGAKDAAQGAVVGFFNWLGLVVPAALAPTLYEKRPFGAAAIQLGGQLISLLAMGAILAAWT